MVMMMIITTTMMMATISSDIDAATTTAGSGDNNNVQNNSKKPPPSKKKSSLTRLQRLKKRLSTHFECFSSSPGGNSITGGGGSTNAIGGNGNGNGNGGREPQSSSSFLSSDLTPNHRSQVEMLSFTPLRDVDDYLFVYDNRVADDVIDGGGGGGAGWAATNEVFSDNNTKTFIKPLNGDLVMIDQLQSHHHPNHHLHHFHHYSSSGHNHSQPQQQQSSSSLVINSGGGGGGGEQLMVNVNNNQVNNIENRIQTIALVENEHDDSMMIQCHENAAAAATNDNDDDDNDGDDDYDNNDNGDHHHYPAPPKPPPRSTSIYHLKRLQQQQTTSQSSSNDCAMNYANLYLADVEQEEESHQSQSSPPESQQSQQQQPSQPSQPSQPPQPQPSSSPLSAVTKKVVMRYKKSTAASQQQSLKKIIERPKSDIYALQSLRLTEYEKLAPNTTTIIANGDNNDDCGNDRHDQHGGGGSGGDATQLSSSQPQPKQQLEHQQHAKSYQKQQKHQPPPPLPLHQRQRPISMLIDANGRPIRQFHQLHQPSTSTSTLQNLIISQQQQLPMSRYSAYEIASAQGFGRMDSYMKLNQLGEGSYATVYKGYSHLLNRVVALKEIRLQAEEGAPFTAIREASLLRELKHANIVTLHDIVHTRTTLILVFEYMDTDFGQYLDRHPGGLNPRNVQLFMFQLLRGLNYCHTRRILHRDLKPQNLLLSELGELKLADFGLARAKSIPSHTYTNEVASLWYRPPDIMLGSRNYSTSLDMWSVGCIFVEMICGVPAFPGVKDVHGQLEKIFTIFGAPSSQYLEQYQSIDEFNFQNCPYTSRTLGEAFTRLTQVSQAESLANAFLQLEPRQRISAGDALQHAFFGDLPKKLFTLPDHVPITQVPGCSLARETNNFSLNVMKIAAKMKGSTSNKQLQQ